MNDISEDCITINIPTWIVCIKELIYKMFVFERILNVDEINQCLHGLLKKAKRKKDHSYITNIYF